MNIPFLSLKDITARHAAELHEAINRVVDSGWYLQGKENELFEKNYARYVGAEHCVTCANGLDALIWIFRAYKEMGVFKAGDEIIVPANTYIATILSITENGLVPVLIEPKWETLEIDDDEIERHISPRTKAICIVHLYGRNAYTDTIGKLCEKYGLKLIEDCAQSHGLKRDASKSVCAWSFYPGKNLGAFGDAGAITTDDAEVAECVRTLANYGSSKKYVFKYTGRNSRMDEIQAAILNVKLKYLDEENAQRQEIANFYYDNISNPSVTLPKRLPADKCVYHQFPVFCKDRNGLQQYLMAHGIGTLIHYPIPPHLQECYAGKLYLDGKILGKGSLPITERIAHEELSLPISPTLTLQEATYIAEVIGGFKLFQR